MRIMLALTAVLARLYFGSNGSDPAICADKQYDSHASSTAAATAAIRISCVTERYLTA